jgi:outer membrane biosynthesis protein TonB
MKGQTFRTALVVSAAIHSLLFLGISPRLMNPRRGENIKVAYLKNPPAPPQYQPRQTQRRKLIEIEDRRRDAGKMLAKAAVSKEEFDRRQPLGAGTAESGVMPKPLYMKEGAGFPAFKKKVTLPQLEMNVKIKSASYNGYYELIREKIRHAAYQNYAQTETGEVYIAFVIGSRGELKDVRYIEERSTPSFYLKEISMRSVKEASPFPPFPGDLDYPQLSFNVIISFQIEG